MTLLLALLLTVPLPDSLPSTPPDTLASLYAHNDSDGLVRLHGSAVRSLSDDLLYRYRLYPLTLDAQYLDDLPEENACATAQDFALLSALWAYRAGEAPPWKMPVYGIRSDALLDRARALDPDDPYVLLVAGQSMLYRPRIFGRSPEKALELFERLRGIVRSRSVPGLSPFEPEVWFWYTLRVLGRPNTDRVRDRLLAQGPPPLFHQFLTDPP
ncbi:MAG: hypothetical protein AAGI91_08630 [Bacteroidota bacterium]